MGVRDFVRVFRPRASDAGLDPEAFDAAVHLLTPGMLRLAARLGPKDAHEDVVQEALIRAWRNRQRFDPSRGAISAWLLTIVANEARRAISRERRPLELNLPTHPIGSSVDRIDLESAVAKLSPRQRLAIDCHYYADLSVKDTAVVMGCSEGTVKSTLAAGRERLRRQLEEYET